MRKMNDDAVTAIIMLNIIAFILASALAPLGFLAWSLFILWEFLIINIIYKYKKTNYNKIKKEEVDLYY